MSSEFDLFPNWVNDILVVLAFIGGPGGFIWLFLNQRQANRKLVVEEVSAESQAKVAEGSLTVDQFNAALPAYKDLLDRANHDRDEAIDKMGEYKDELTEVNDKLTRLIVLFQRVVKRHKIQLTQEEMDELEATRPRPVTRRHRPRTS